VTWILQGIKKFRSILSLTLAISLGSSLSGCVLNDNSANPEAETIDDQSESTSTPISTAGVSVVSTSAHDVYLPEGVFSETAEGDFDGAMLSAGSTAIDVTGFVAQRPAFNLEANAEGMMDTFDSLMGGIISGSFSITGRQSIAGFNAVIASYNLTLNVAVTPTNLANQLVQYFGINLNGGAIINLPTGSASDPLATEYTLIIGVVYFSVDDVVVLAALVPSNLAGTYAHLTGGITTPTNVNLTAATLATTTDNFTAEAGGGIADFLFVIDNSGSMGNDQAAVSTAASEFASVLSNSGLDFRLGVIMTDRTTLRDTNGDGAFTSDLAEFQIDVAPGTGGSGNESGIYHGEAALLAIAQGDVSDGSVTLESYPRAGASLSIIMVSDENDQYTRYSGGISFDTSNNLFIDRGYRVYSIVGVSYSPDYLALATATGGQYSDISDLTAMPTIMSNIASDAGGSASLFQLANTPIAATILVTNNGTTVANSAVNGWTYNTTANTVVFHGTAVPAAGDVININYQYLDSSAP